MHAIIDSIAKKLDDVALEKHVQPKGYYGYIVGTFQGLRVSVVLHQENMFSPIQSEISIDTGPLHLSMFREGKGSNDKTFVEPREVRDTLLSPSIEDRVEGSRYRISLRSSLLTWNHYFSSRRKTFPLEVLVATARLARSAMQAHCDVLDAKRLASGVPVDPFRASIYEINSDSEIEKRAAALDAFESVHLKRWQKQDRRDLWFLFLRCVVYGAVIAAGLSALEGLYWVMQLFTMIGAGFGVYVGVLATARRFFKNRTFEKRRKKHLGAHRNTNSKQRTLAHGHCTA